MSESEDNENVKENQEKADENDSSFLKQILSKLSPVLLVPFVWFTIVLTINYLGLSVQEVFQVGTYLSVEFWVVWFLIFLATSIVFNSAIFVLLAIVLVPYLWIRDREDSD